MDGARAWAGLVGLADRATLSALATVLAVDVYAVYRANEAQLRARGGVGRSGPTLQDQFLLENAQALESESAYMVPVVLTLTLLVLFFFVRSIGVVLTALTALSGVFAGVFFLWPAGEFGARLARKAGLPARDDGVLELAVTAPAAVAVVLVWLFSGHWAANNLIGIFTCVLFASLCRVHSLRTAGILFAGLFVYDVFFVFFSEYVFGKNVMVEVATSAPHNPAATIASWFSLPFTPVQNLALPAKLMFPDSAGSFTILGLGDVMLPAILLVYLLSADLNLDLPVSTGLCARGIAAHFAGLVSSFFCNVAFDSAQPALFYIVPAMISVTVVSAKNWGILPALWEGTLGRRAYTELVSTSETSDIGSVQEKELFREP